MFVGQVQVNILMHVEKKKTTTTKKKKTFTTVKTIDRHDIVFITFTPCNYFLNDHCQAKMVLRTMETKISVPHFRRCALRRVCEPSAQTLKTLTRLRIRADCVV